MFDNITRGGLVTASGVRQGRYMGVKDGKIAYIGAEDPGAVREKRSLDGVTIFPGVIDAQVHSRSQNNHDGFTYATKAAAAGGVTTSVDMPYDEGLLVCSAAAVAEKAADVAAEAHVDVGLFGTIDPREGTARISEQVAAGVCAFKFSTFGTDPVRILRIPPQMMAEAFAEIAKAGFTAGVHNENDEVVRSCTEKVKAERRCDYLAHGLSHTPLAEQLAMAEIYEIGAFTGCAAHVVHCCLGRGIEICQSYKRQGFAASVEVCIHYLMFDEDNDVRQLGGLAKVNPPLRPRVETEKLWAHLTAGSIGLVSTDHVAWSLDRKNNSNMLANASGGPSLEILVPTLIKGCTERGISLSVAAQVLAQNQARPFRLSAIKGAVSVGCDADFCVIDPELAAWRVESSQTVSDWSLYDGLKLPRVKETWLRGRQIWDGTSVLNDPRDGALVKPFQN